VSGRIGIDGKWYNTDNTSLVDSIVPSRYVKSTDSCMTLDKSFGFKVQSCSMIKYGFCGKVAMTEVSTEICYRKKDFIDSSNVYVKSICEVMEFIAYDDAFAMCQSALMDLFVIDSVEANLFLFNFSFLSFDTTSWINGKRETLRPWFTRVDTSEKVSIFSNISWAYEVDYSPSNCLGVIRNGRNYEVTSYRCEEKFKFFCEYRKWDLLADGNV
jgi:hypothetical protein